MAPSAIAWRAGNASRSTRWRSCSFVAGVRVLAAQQREAGARRVDVGVRERKVLDGEPLAAGQRAVVAHQLTIVGPGACAFHGESG